MWQKVVDWLVFDTIGLSRDSALGSALDFFVYDTVKIFFLLVVIIFAIAFLRSFFPPEKTKRILEKVPQFLGNILAALLGIVTPFCSCSAVPLFIGFIEAGHSAGSHVLIPCLVAHGQRGCPHHALGSVRLEDRPPLYCKRDRRGHRQRLRDREAEARKWVEEYVYKIKAGRESLRSFP